MSAYKIAAFSCVSCLLATMLKKEKPEIASLLQIASAVTIILSCASTVGFIVRELTSLCEGYGLSSRTLKLLMRALCMSVSGEWAAAFCKDSGMTALAVTVEVMVSVLLLSMCMPLLRTVLEFAAGFF